MKRLLLALVSVVLFSAMPVIAAEKGNMQMDHSDSVRQCALEAETIQEKIKRLETEVGKGNRKYDDKELKNLRQKLSDANKILDNLNRGN